jgi:hypothetical protein
LPSPLKSQELNTQLKAFQPVAILRGLEEPSEPLSEHGMSVPFGVRATRSEIPSPSKSPTGKDQVVDARAAPDLARRIQCTGSRSRTQPTGTRQTSAPRHRRAPASAARSWFIPAVGQTAHAFRPNRPGKRPGATWVKDHMCLREAFRLEDQGRSALAIPNAVDNCARAVADRRQTRRVVQVDQPRVV